MGDYVKRCVSGYSGREARRNRDTARWRRYTPRVYSRCPPRPVHAPIEYTPPYLDACTDRSRVYRTTDVNFIHFALSLSLYLSFVVLFHPRYEELIHHVSSTCSSSCSRISKGIDFFFLNSNFVSLNWKNWLEIGGTKQRFFLNTFRWCRLKGNWNERK